MGSHELQLVFLFFLLIFLRHCCFASAAHVVNMGSKETAFPCNMTRSSIAECQGENELLLDSEINRRILASSSYISYDALKKNNPVNGGSPRGGAYTRSDPTCIAVSNTAISYVNSFLQSQGSEFFSLESCWTSF